MENRNQMDFQSFVYVCHTEPREKFSTSVPL